MGAKIQRNASYLEDLADFLYRAKQETWAGNGAFEQLPDGGKRYSFSEGNWKYVDEYLGYLNSQGQEVASCNGKPLWGMVYAGRMVSFPKNVKNVEQKKTFAHESFEFLKRALQNPPINFPVRGPPRFGEDNPFSYMFTWEGNLNDFSGEENIWWFPPNRPSGFYLAAGGNPGKDNLERVVFTQKMMGGLIIGKE